VVEKITGAKMSKPPLRIIFMGTPDFAAATLQALIDGPDEIVAVVTQPDRAKGRGKKLTPPPTKVLAEAAGIPVLQPTKIKTEEFRNGLLTYQPDVIVVTAYGRILPKSLLELAPFGCINVHGSLLPKYRGAAPIQWTVINGDQEAGITIIQMDEGMDTGDMLLKAKITTDPDETAGSLFDKLAILGSATLLKAITGLKEGTITPVAQDHDQATVAPMLKKDDGLIDWHKDARDIECLVRGLDPWPTAFCFLDSKRLRLFSPEVLHKDGNAQPGTVLQADKRGILVACGTNSLLIREIQPEGKKRMAVESFLCGHPIATGTLLTKQLTH
jgi:methionyl-tRNA formyltransferase